MRHMNELIFQEVKRLRNQVIINSCFLEDYDNTFGVDPHEVYDYFDGYLEYLAEIAGPGADTQSILEEDTLEHLYSYY